nr:putative disease resistance protein At3g14460 isoform X4 [Malus domestica]
MHDLMHDLATYVCGEFCIRLEDHDFSLDVVSKGRHFSYLQYSSNVDYKRFGTIYEAKYLRTFILGVLYSPTVRLDLILMLQCLRVLKLRVHDITELPDLISNLKHLRYLDLCNTPIQKLPDTVCSLCNLQTLLLSNCTCLAELPTDLRRLINLRHLDLRGTKIKKMPPHMGKLKDLQTFGGEFVLSKDAGGYIDELKGFQHLSGNLHISGLQNIKHAEDALEAKLRDKKLSEIHLQWEGDTADSQNDSRVLGNLQPNTNLKVLAIKGYGGIKFPGWLGDESFSNLITLRLQNCGYCFSLPALGRLTSLKWLEIDGLNGVESVGSELYGPAFKSVEFLSFRNMREWQEWCFPGGEEEEGGHFPNLCELSLENCPKLTGKLPLYYFPRLERLILQKVNIESLAYSQECNKFKIELPSLRDLRISDCPNLVCFVGGGVLLAPNLKWISMCHFKNLWSVPEEMHASLPSLQSLSIKGCKEFKSFPEESKFPSLNHLFIMNCPEFRSLPKEMHASLPSLQSLFIEGSKEFKSFAEESKFPSLEVLNIWDCPELESFPEGGLPSKLRSLRIGSCKKLMANRMRWGLQTLTSLKVLDVSFSECEEEETVESFPEEGLLPTTLTSLGISHHPNLKTIDGKALRQIISLKKLTIFFCPRLQSLPDEGLPTSLFGLEIRECDLLTQRCQRDTGEYWAKISHIPNVVIDDREI